MNKITQEVQNYPNSEVPTKLIFKFSGNRNLDIFSIQIEKTDKDKIMNGEYLSGDYNFTMSEANYLSSKLFQLDMHQNGFHKYSDYSKFINELYFSEYSDWLISDDGNKLNTKAVSKLVTDRFVFDVEFDFNLMISIVQHLTINIETILVQQN